MNLCRFLFLILLALGLAIACAQSSSSRCAADHIAHESQLQLANYDAAVGKTVTLCRGGYDPQTVTVYLPSDTSVKLLYLDESKEPTFEPTRWDGSCNDMVRERRGVSEAVPVALSSTSFQDFKLCYEDSEHLTVSFVEKKQSCPAGDEEQKTPVDDCSTLGTTTKVLDSWSD